jgi:hypothetical protein
MNALIHATEVEPAKIGFPELYTADAHLALLSTLDAVVSAPDFEAALVSLQGDGSQWTMADATWIHGMVAGR